MSATQDTAAAPHAGRLRGAFVGVRDDLEVSRHVFRGAPSYVIRDPLTFHTQRLSVHDYDIFISIDAQRPLGEVFADLLDRAKLTAADEQHFYNFVLDLHRLGFLRLPVSDHQALYRRYQAKQQARRRQRFMALLFFKVPLYNPDALLHATVHRARPLFSRTAFVLWCLLILCAAGVAGLRWRELLEPLEGLLVARNLVMMWLTLVTLKVVHEFGHAYACKHYGGHVPEMGAFIMLFTPCAYMDATSSWGFSNKYHRLVVCLAGVYVETAIAAVAVFVWAATAPGLMHALAYNVFFLAGIVTVLFNINPLMRFDGYYALSDLLEIPNLRQRSTAYLHDCLKRLFLGIQARTVPQGRRLKVTLLAFGIAAAVYRVALMVSIAMLIASKVFVIGLILGGVYVLSTLYGMLRRLLHFLWRAEETAAVRGRAAAVSAVLLAGLPAVIALVPVGQTLHVAAVVAARQEFVVHTAEPGFLETVDVAPGQLVAAQQPLARLANLAHEGSIAEARAQLEAATIRRDAQRFANPLRALQEEQRVQVARLVLSRQQSRQQDLVLRAAQAGRVLDTPSPRDVGRFIPAGTPLATLASGGWQVRALLTQEQMAAASPRSGDVVEFRAAAAAQASWPGTVERVIPRGSRSVHATQLTHLAGGQIPVDALTGQAAQPYFEIVIQLQDGPNEDRLLHGMTGKVRFAAEPVSIGTQIVRSLVRFRDDLSQR